MTGLTMICPSRGRAHHIQELAACWKQTGAKAHLIVAVDDDDPDLDPYLYLDVDLRILSEPRRLGPILNAVAVQAATGAAAVGFLGDDHRPRTPGWDERLLAALEDGPGVAYGNDLLQGVALPTAAVVSAEVVRGLGYMAPPGLAHLYLDDFWKRLGTDLGRLRYLPEVVIEHLHPLAGKAEWDEGYRRVNDPALYQADGAAYQRFLAERWLGDLARLREHLNG